MEMVMGKVTADIRKMMVVTVVTVITVTVVTVIIMAEKETVTTVNGEGTRMTMEMVVGNVDARLNQAINVTKSRLLVVETVKGTVVSDNRGSAEALV